METIWSEAPLNFCRSGYLRRRPTSLVFCPTQLLSQEKRRGEKRRDERRGEERMGKEREQQESLTGEV